LQQTAERQGFVPNSMGHLEDLYETLGPMCRIFLAEHDGRPIAGMLAIAFGDTVVYKRGAWSGQGGKLRPNEAMHWEAIRWAIGEGYSRYDFDGIELDAAQAALAGEKLPRSAVNSVSRFKLGFGGDAVLLPEASVHVPNRLLRFGHDHVYSRISGLGPVKRLVKRMRVG
ncbi:MAG: GNAT family N-acetyltransferase, partial [Halobacteriales archaeon]|nr:GNAT family N-acetyltransferase [Halobacteriales archaeon]